MNKTICIGIAIAAFALCASCVNDEMLYQRGVEFFESGNYEKAAAFFTQAIKKKPGSRYYCARASAYFSLEQYSSAINDYTGVINHDKNYTDAYLGRGLSYFALKNYGDSIKDLVYYTQTEQTSYDAYYYLGLGYTNTQNAEKTVESYTRAIGLSPDSAPALLQRGYAYVQLKKYAEARGDFKKVLAIDPENKAAAESLAKLEDAESNEIWDFIKDIFTTGDAYTDLYNFGFQLGLDLLLGD